MRGARTTTSAGAPSSNRRQPARFARTASGRPSNYYARPSGYQLSTGAPAGDDPTTSDPPGFFPAITHFTDGLSALPKEVMRHFTLIKETEGKAYLPGQTIGETLDLIAKLPEPPKDSPKPYTQPVMAFSLNNSVNGSAAPSVVDGNLPGTQQSMSDMEDRPHEFDEQLEARRLCFSKLRDNVKVILGVLDEKNMVLASANETLARCLARLDGTIPYIEGEVSEEARLGSKTHWALPHMRELRKAGQAANDRSRRDVQATNSLAAAAAAVHEGDIAAKRSEARRDAMQAKRRQNVDSDFDERPPVKRAPAGARSRKPQEISGATDAKGAAAPQPNKRRRVDKASGAAMERSISGATASRNGTGPQRERETGNEGPARKKNKPLPAAAVGRKRNAPSSPSIASSPTRGTFATVTNKEMPSAAAPRGSGNSRGRQNSAISNKALGRENSRNRATSAASSGGLPIGQGPGVPDSKNISNALHKNALDPRPQFKSSQVITDADVLVAHGILPPQMADGYGTTAETTDASSLKREEAELADSAALPYVSRDDNASTSRNAVGGRASKPSTPVESEAAASVGMARSRSMRGYNNNNNGAGAGRAGAAANSPVTRPADDAGPARRTQKKTAKAQAGSGRSSPSPFGEAPLAAAAPNSRKTGGGGAAGRNGAVSVAMDDDDGAAAQAEDGYVSSDEPRYCICNGPSYGHMIGCDNDECPREWFHLACVGMTKLPASKAKWYCDECKENNLRSKEQQRKR